VSPPARFGMIDLDKNDETVLSFVEKSDTQGTLINGGFFVLEPGVFDYIDGDASIWERQPMARLAADGQMSCYRHPGFWKPMDTLRERKELEKLWSTSAPWRIWD
jgi:glucose-1-phosphate cytidylyltransferase